MSVVMLSSAARTAVPRNLARVSHDPQVEPEQRDQVDFDVLRWLLRYPFQRVEDLALAVRLTPASVYRRLTRLEYGRLIECLTPASLGKASCRLYYLSNLGLHVLANGMGADPVQLARGCGADERGLLRLLPRLPALMAIQFMINSLIAGAPTALAGYSQQAVVRWHWVRGWRQQFEYRDRPATCSADAAVVLHVRPGRVVGRVGANTTLRAAPQTDRWFVFVILLDTCAQGRHGLTHRLDALLRYRECPERWPVHPGFPLVLVLVESRHRAMVWQHLALQPSTHRGAPLAGAVGCADLGSACDPWHMSWWDLTSGRSRPLAELLVPLPADAVPPSLHVAQPWYSGSSIERSTSKRVPENPTRRPTRVIRGAFEQRSCRALAAPLESTGHAQHTQTSAMLLGPALGRQQWRILELLFAHPLLSADDLAAALDVDGGSAERYLRPLRHNGCVVAVDRPPEARFHLSQPGLRLIAAAQHLPVRTVAAPGLAPAGLQRGVPALLRHLDHTAEVYSFFTTLLRAAQAARAVGRLHRLVWWETGSACGRRYRYHGCWHNLAPDGEGVYQADRHALHFWLEWDRGTMRHRDLYDKFAAYAEYVEAGEWHAERHGTALPALLIVVPNPAQEARVTQMARETLAESRRLSTYVAVTPRLEAYGPLASIWKPCMARFDPSHDTLTAPLLRAVFT